MTIMKFFKKNYSKLMYIPLVLGIIALFLAFVYPGLEKGIDLKGGNQINIHFDDQKDFSLIEPTLKEKFNLAEVHISETKSINQYGLLIELSLQEDIELVKEQRSKLDYTANLETVKEQVNTTIVQPLEEKGFITEDDYLDITLAKNIPDLKAGVNELIIIANNNFTNQVTNIIKGQLDLTDDSKIQIREVAPTLGKDFVRSSAKAGIIAFALLVAVILLFFREIIPSGLIILAAVFDVIFALAGMAIFNISLSLTTIPALLMLVGYSVDTDILLTARVLKDKTEGPIDSANTSIKTGLTMTITTVSTVIVMLLISYFSQLLVVFEISVILLCGLVGDVIATWTFNAPALIRYAERKNKNRH